MGLLFWRNRRTTSATQAKALIDEGAVLVDVREAQEWRAGHAPGATHIPLGQLQRRMSSLPKDRTVIAVCRSGGRSRMATSQLSQAGYEVRNLSGGMVAWERSGLPLVTDKGKPGRVR